MKVEQVKRLPLVLILVLLEYTLWVLLFIIAEEVYKIGLNPCFTGIYSLRNAWWHWIWIWWICLNPCFTGIYSLSRVSATIVRHLLYSLNPCFTGIYSLRQLWKPSCVRYWRVLILVLLEYTLWAFVNVLQMRNISGLNPCFTGIYSLSPLGISVGNTYTICLNPCFTGIYSLRTVAREQQLIAMCLNPCFIGIYSLRLYLLVESNQFVQS